MRTVVGLALISSFISSFISLTGCKNTVGNIATDLSAISATGCKIGQTGKLRITFTGPVSGDTDVALVALTPTIATVPDHVTVPAGSLNADFDYSGLVVGAGAVTATVAGITRTTTLNVVDDFRLSGVTSSVALEQNAVAPISFSLNASPPVTTDIAVTVADANVAGAPAKVTIAPFSSSQTLYVNGIAMGSTKLSAALGGVTTQYTVVVVDHARLRSMSVSTQAETGATLNLSANLDAYVALTTSITVNNGNPAVTGLPATLTVPAGSQSAQATFTVGGNGGDQLSLTLGDSSVSSPFNVVSTAALSSISLPSLIAPGSGGVVTVSLNTVSASPHTVMLVANDPSILTVPPSVTVPAGQSSVTASVSGLKEGNASVLATLDGISVGATTHVGAVNISNPLYLGGPSAIAVGAYGSFPLYTYNYGQAVTLTSSDPTVIAVPSMLTIAYGQSLALVALKAGTTTLTASSAGMTTSLTVTVVDKAELSETPASVNLAVGQTETSYLYLNAQAPTGSVMTFVSSDPTVVTVPASVLTTDGNSYVTVSLQGLVSGTSVITATLNGSSKSFVVYVGGSVGSNSTISGAGADNPTLQIGASTVAYVNLVSATPTDVPATVTFSTPGIVAVLGSSPVIVAGQSQAYFALRGVNTGNTIVLVTVGGITQTFTATVVANPTFTLSVPTPLMTGTTETATLSVDCTLVANATFSIASMDPATATVSTTTVTLAPGSQGTAVYFGVKGVANGTTSITASKGSTELTGSVTVN